MHVFSHSSVIITYPSTQLKMKAADTSCPSAPDHQAMKACRRRGGNAQGTGSLRQKGMVSSSQGEMTLVRTMDDGFPSVAVMERRISVLKGLEPNHSSCS